MFTTPPPTVATLVLLEFHDTALFVALDGDTVGVSVKGALPAVLDTEAVFSVTPVTGTFTVGRVSVISVGETPTVATGTDAAVTVTEHSAVKPPSDAVTVILAVPAPTMLTTPLLTVATFVLLEFHDTALFVAFGGDIVGVSVKGAFPVVLDIDAVFSVTPVTGTFTVGRVSVIPVGETLIPVTGAFAAIWTVTTQDAVNPQLLVVAVIAAVPVPTMTAMPSLTVTTPVLLELHVTLLSVALDGDTVGVSANGASPTVLDIDVISSVIPVAGISSAAASAATLIHSAPLKPCSSSL
jgi:hypothetical protein